MNLFTFLCDDARAAEEAARAVGHLRNTRRLFVFLGDPPTADQLAWLAPGDRKIVLAHATQWCENPTALGVRAALLECEGLHIFFCYASSPPTNATADLVRIQLAQTDSVASNIGIWGVARDHVIVAGFEEAMPPSGISESKLTTADHLSIGLGLRGMPVNEAAALAVLKETLPIRSIILHESFWMGTTPDRQTLLLARKIEALGEKPHDGTFSGMSQIVGHVDADTFSQILDATPSTSAAIRFVQGENTISETDSHKPYRIVRIKDGPAILLFAGKGG